MVPARAVGGAPHEDPGGGDAGGDAGAEEGGGDTALLTAPANRSRDPNGRVPRNDGKGRMKVASRKDAEAKSSARKRSKKAAYGASMAGIDKYFPGKTELGSVANGAFESVNRQDIYHNEESKLFKVSHDIKVLIESLELKKDETQ